MVSSTENIGRLVANEVLLQTERQLLQNRGKSGQQPTDKQPTATPAPISHNEKVVSSVLLTLLDEQLDARLAASADGFRNQAPTQQPADDMAAGASRIAAQYAEADAVFRPDFPTNPPLLPTNATNQQALLAAASPELRIAMQSAFFTAAVHAQTENADIVGRKGRRGQLEGANGAVLIRIGLAGVAVLALGILLAAGLAR